MPAATKPSMALVRTRPSLRQLSPPHLLLAGYLRRPTHLPPLTRRHDHTPSPPAWKAASPLHLPRLPPFLTQLRPLARPNLRWLPLPHHRRFHGHTTPSIHILHPGSFNDPAASRSMSQLQRCPSQLFPTSPGRSCSFSSVYSVQHLVLLQFIVVCVFTSSCCCEATHSGVHFIG
uniref:Uncharacterized protein n=1 Tax=Triticum urartu TaxID=4572 RepID=A0A8R7THD6_TRIUA